MSYTFGDHQAASRRLHRLAELYEPETRGLLEFRSGLKYEGTKLFSRNHFVLTRSFPHQKRVFRY
jgi:hypothetical protein